MSNLRYRPDIDGLRTLAVVPVVLYHAGIAGFSGGFVGVDVFFVISGFLITGILLGDIEQNRFSIVEFYKRRIRRILPALLIVLALTTMAAWIFLPPSNLEAYGNSMGFVTLFASNFWFRKAVDYFAVSSEVQPLLHTWSLAVEEQFYIFYPILLYFLAKTRVKLAWVLLGIGAASLVLAIALLPYAPSAVFYLLPTRAWELIVGGLLACGAVPRNERIDGPIGVLGAALIVLSVVFYDSATPFPGLAAIPPCLGAAMLIWSGSGPTYRVLASAPFVRVGQASYSYYLWHFPIFAFADYLVGGHFSPAVGLVLSALSLLLAFATLYLIENPVRKSKARAAYTVPLAAMVAFGLVGFALARSGGAPARLDARSAMYVATAGDEMRHHSECMTNTSVVEDACLLGDKQAQPHVLLWGDSHAMVAATPLEAQARQLNASFLFAADADCPPGIGFSISDTTQPGLTRSTAYRYCKTYNDRMLALALNDPRITTVVFAARWTNWRIGAPGNPVETPVDIRLEDANGIAPSEKDNAKIWETGFRRLLDRLHKAGKKVFIVGPLPEPPFNVPQRFYVSQFGFVATPSTLPLSDYTERNRRILAFFKTLPDVSFLWPTSKLCSKNSCALGDRQGLYYFDQDHLSVRGSLKTTAIYSPVFQTKP